MRLILNHVKNVDLMHGQGNGTGYWDKPIDPPSTSIKVKDLKEAREVFCRWRDKNGLGGGNMGENIVIADDGVITYISYNGRMWDGPSDENWKKRKEIKIA